MSEQLRAVNTALPPSASILVLPSPPSALANLLSLQQGEVDCWPLPCPEVECEFSVLPESECCPRCVTDPCQADTIRNDITKTCLDEMNVVRFTGSSWIKHGTECTLCQCKVKAIIFRWGALGQLLPGLRDINVHNLNNGKHFIAYLLFRERWEKW